MRKLNFPLFFLLFVISASYSIAQPKKGKYKPTKFDSVKKVIPPQVYGNVSEVLRADSIAKAAALQKELEQKEQEAMAKKAAEKKLLDEQKLLDEKKKKAQKYQRPPANKVVEKRPVQPNRVNTKPIAKPQEKKVITKPVVSNVKPEKKKQVKTTYTLEECIAYAKANNLQVAEALLDERYAQLLYEENKNSRYPDLNGAVNIGKAFGRNIDPATNQFVTNNFNYNTATLYSQTLLFGWFQKRYQLEKNQLDIQAASYANDQLKDDISLNITTGFMRVLQAREALKMAEGSLKNTSEYVDESAKKFNADNTIKMQLNSMLANDSAVYMEANTNARLALLQLKALMNFDFNDEFDIRTAENDAIQIGRYASLPEAEVLYNTALQERGSMHYHQMKLLSAKKSLDIAKAMQYPQLSLYANMGSVFSSNITNITSQTYEGESSVGYVNISGSSYPVTSSQYNFDTRVRPVGDQYRDHLRAGIGLGITVPILNGYSARAHIQRAKIGLVSEQINSDAEKLKLRQQIYQLYEEAKGASQKYIAYKRASDESGRMVDAMQAKQRAAGVVPYETGRANEVHYLNQTKALHAKYDLLFKLKMLDYFTGSPLKM